MTTESVEKEARNTGGNPREEAAPNEKSEFMALDILDLELLALLKKEPRSGYELRKDLIRLFDNRVSFGTLYPHSKDLVEARLIVGEWLESGHGQSRKNNLHLSELGRETLKSNLARLSKITSAIETLSL